MPASLQCCGRQRAQRSHRSSPQRNGSSIRSGAFLPVSSARNSGSTLFQSKPTKVVSIASRMAKLRLPLRTGPNRRPDAMQNKRRCGRASTKTSHLLTGLLFDDAGHRMIPTHATKAGVRYRYYVSQTHLKGESKTISVGSVSRIPATDIEDIIVKSVNEHLIAQKEKSASGIGNIGDRQLVLEQVARVVVHDD